MRWSALNLGRITGRRYCVNTLAGIVTFLAIQATPAQPPDPFAAWLTQALEAPPETPEPSPPELQETPEDQATSPPPESPGRSEIQAGPTRSELLANPPEIASEAPLYLSTQELAILSALLSQLDPETEITPSIFLERIRRQYTWDLPTQDQLSFLAMMYAPPPEVSDNQERRLVVEPDRGEEFWSQIEPHDPPSQSVVVEAESWSPDDYLQAIREAISHERWRNAEELCERFLHDFPQLPAVLQQVTHQFWLRALLPQQPLPTERVEAAVSRLDAEGAFADETAWNLGLRLLLRRVAAAEEPQEKTARWREGLERYGTVASGLRLQSSTLSEIERFLALSGPDRALEADVVLNGLLAMGLDVTAQRHLMQRKIAYHQRAGDAKAAAEAAWVHLVLQSSPDGELLPALDQYAALAREAGRPRAEQALIDAQTTRGAYWEETSIPVSAQAGPTSDSLELRRHKAALGLIRGPAAEGLVSEQHALATASVDELWRRFDTLGMLAVRGTRDLRSASEPLRWHLRRLTPPPPEEVDSPEMISSQSEVRLSTTGGRDDSLEARLEDSWSEAVASAPDAVEAWIRESGYVQRLVLRNQLQRRSDAAVGWAADALQTGRPELSALFWGQALTDAALAQDPNDPAPESLEQAVNTLASTLRGLDNPDTAITTIGRVDRELRDPTVRVPVLFLGATWLYEQGRMTDCLIALDQVEALDPPWDGSQRLAAGLIRAVAQLKLGRFDNAESVLADLADFDGENEVMAQVAFLRGWIHLNRNDNAAALDRFRDLVATYPGTRYAAQTRELIRRLETTVFTPAPGSG